MILHEHTPQELEITNKGNTIIVKTKQDIQKENLKHERINLLLSYGLFFLMSTILGAIIMYFAKNINF
jgi:hypothetical protein